MRNEPRSERELFWRSIISTISTATLVALAITVLVISV
jgi:hypothetical protein